MFKLGKDQGFPPLWPTNSELLGETIILVNHRINNFLQVIKGGGFLLETGIAKEDLDLISRGWSTVRSKQDRLAELLSKVVSLKDQHALTVENVDLGDLLKGCLQDWEKKLAARMLKLNSRKLTRGLVLGLTG